MSVPLHPPRTAERERRERDGVNGRITAQVQAMGGIVKRLVERSKEAHVLVVWTALVFGAGATVATAFMNYRGLPGEIKVVKEATAATAQALSEHVAESTRRDSMRVQQMDAMFVRIMCGLREKERNMAIPIDTAVAVCHRNMKPMW